MKKIVLALILLPSMIKPFTMPDFALLKTSVASAEKTFISCVFRSSAQIVEHSEHKALGTVLVALAAVGAGYVVTRPYVWGRVKSRDMQALTHENELLRYQLALADQEAKFQQLKLENSELQQLKLKNSELQQKAIVLERQVDYLKVFVPKITNDTATQTDAQGSV